MYSTKFKYTTIYIIQTVSFSKNMALSSGVRFFDSSKNLRKCFESEIKEKLITVYATLH